MHGTYSAYSRSLFSLVVRSIIAKLHPPALAHLSCLAHRNFLQITCSTTACAWAPVSCSYYIFSLTIKVVMESHPRTFPLCLALSMPLFPPNHPFHYRYVWAPVLCSCYTFSLAIYLLVIESHPSTLPFSLLLLTLTISHESPVPLPPVHARLFCACPTFAR
jgi:hypothetical protein